MSLELNTFEEITGAKLEIGTPLTFAKRPLIYAGETFDAKDNLTDQRMICEKKGEPIQYRVDKLNRVYMKIVSPENPLYYPYKKLLEAQK